jgi:hypothetical protein
VVWLQPSDSWPNILLAYFSVDSFNHSRENESLMTASQANQTESLNLLFISGSAMKSWLLLGTFHEKQETQKVHIAHPYAKSKTPPFPD